MAVRSMGARRPVVLFLVALLLVVPAVADRQRVVALADMVPASDPLAAQDVRFDARFAEMALDYLEAPGLALLREIAALPASAHLLAHARQFDYDVPQTSPDALVAALLKRDGKTAAAARRCRTNLAFVSKTMLRDPHWVADVLRDLPAGFRFRGSTLFLTYGYDIGVALAPSASLNLAHAKFERHPRELLYYAIHEMHHVGFMTYHAPRRIADLRTCADVLAFVQYATQMEGMAVHAAMERRRQESALADDPDYVALGDPAVMQQAEAQYEAIYETLRRRGEQRADGDAMNAIEQMSGKRLWYRVGAKMATAIDERMGRAALTQLVQDGPTKFFDAYRGLRWTLDVERR